MVTEFRVAQEFFRKLRQKASLTTTAASLPPMSEGCERDEKLNDDKHLKPANTLNSNIEKNESRRMLRSNPHTNVGSSIFSKEEMLKLKQELFK
jgi:hypothetical protein